MTRSARRARPGPALGCPGCPVRPPARAPWPCCARPGHAARSAQLYLRGDIAPGRPGFWVLRQAPEQWICPAAFTTDAAFAADTPVAARAHQMDLEWARTLLGPRCDALIRIDGPDRPAIDCPRRPTRRVTWSSRAGRGRLAWARQGCLRHVPAMVDEADHAVTRARDPRWGDPGWPAPVIADVALLRTTRDRARGRPGA